MRRLFDFVAVSFALVAVPMVAHASLPAQPIPEPDSLALVAVGVVALIVAKVRNRRK